MRFYIILEKPHIDQFVVFAITNNVFAWYARQS